MEQNNKKDRSNQSSEKTFSEPERNCNKSPCSSGQPEVNPSRQTPEEACTEKDLDENKNTEEPFYVKMNRIMDEWRAAGIPVIDLEPQKGQITVMFNPPQSWVDSFRESQKEQARQSSDSPKPEGNSSKDK